MDIFLVVSFRSLAALASCVFTTDAWYARFASISRSLACFCICLRIDLAPESTGPVPYSILRDCVALSLTPVTTAVPTCCPARRASSTYSSTPITAPRPISLPTRCVSLDGEATLASLAAASAIPFDVAFTTLAPTSPRIGFILAIKLFTVSVTDFVM